jgi:hypothetical protein
MKMEIYKISLILSVHYKASMHWAPEANVPKFQLDVKVFMNLKGELPTNNNDMTCEKYL